MNAMTSNILVNLPALGCSHENQVTFCYLTNLPITPPQYFQTVSKQLVEF